MNYKKASAFKKKFPGMKHPLLNKKEKRERPKGEIIKKMNKDLKNDKLIIKGVDVDKEEVIDINKKENKLELRNVENGGKKIVGMGDVIETVTKFFGWDKCNKCENRRKFLNKKFPFIQHSKNWTQDEIDFIKRVGRLRYLETDDCRKIFNTYNRVFNQNVKFCLCAGTIKDLQQKLFNTYLSFYSHDEDEFENIMTTKEYDEWLKNNKNSRENI